MKKTILLALLAGSMLASCATAAKVDVNHGKVDGLAGVFEDTDAHEEIFGNQVLPFAGSPKSAPIDPLGGDATIKLGVQKAVFDSKIAVRFIAAISVPDSNSNGTIESSELAAVTATWTRAVYENGGDVVTGKGSDELVSHKAYTSLNNGGVDYTITQFNTANSTSFTHFVVYTIGGIVNDGTFNDCYITAKLTLSGSASGTSKTLATTVDLDTKFVFDSTADGYFAVKYDDSEKTFSTIEAEGSPSGTNLADFTSDGIAVDTDDDFVIVHFDNEDASPANWTFKVYGYTAMNAGVGHGCFAQEETSEFCSSKCNNTVFNVFLNSEEKIYLTVHSATISMTIYLNISECSDWTAATAGYWLNAIGSDSNQVWFKMTEVKTNYYSCSATFKSDQRLIFVRHSPSVASGTWDGLWNQTVNASFSFADQCNVRNFKGAFGDDSGKYLLNDWTNYGD